MIRCGIYGILGWRIPANFDIIEQVISTEGSIVLFRRKIA
jgi:hypothetical protein